MGIEQNLKNWTSCWKDLEEAALRQKNMGSADLWEQRADGFAQGLSPKRKLKRTDEVFDLLAEAGFTSPGARVLDIGCGPGRIAIPLAREGARVTGLDISAKGLEYLEANARDEGLKIETVQATWWKANIEKLGLRKKFDLVVASMTPAIKDAKRLEMAMACSKRFCYYSGFLRSWRGGEDPELQQILRGGGKGPGGPKRADSVSPFLNHFMYLYLSGYRPLVRLQHGRRRTVSSWEEAAERTLKFNVVTDAKSAAALRRKVRAYYQAKAVDGKHTSVLEIYTGMMVWNVRERA